MPANPYPLPDPPFVVPPRFSTEDTVIQGDIYGTVRSSQNPYITVYRIIREDAQNLTAEPELRQAGIYLLENDEEGTLYVGQADSRDNGHGLLARMLEKHSGKQIDNWTVGYALTCASPTFFGATELNYLERYFYDAAQRASRRIVLNGNRPHATEPSFSIKNTLTNYIGYANFILTYRLFCDAFVPGGKVKPPMKTKEQPGEPKPITPRTIPPMQTIELFIDRAKSGVKATGLWNTATNEILIKAGSTIRPESNLEHQSRQQVNADHRNQLIADGIVVDFVFVKDYTFSAPSTAASIILGTASSGTDQWKDKNGVLLKELRGKNE